MKQELTKRDHSHKGRCQWYNSTMGLNIKNEEVHRLIKQLAEISGESQTEAVKHAVEERIQRLDKRDGRLEKIFARGKDCAARLRAKGVTADHADFLFGPDGMPS